MNRYKYNIYKTTNLVNGKFYWGVHDSLDENDGYFGSSVALQNAIRKYGKENFIRETKLLYKTANEAYEDEAFVVNEKMIKNCMCYNMSTGGRGGDKLSHHPKKKEIIEKISGTLKKRLKNKENHWMYGKHLSEETKKKLSETRIKLGLSKGKNNPSYGGLSTEHKLKISETLKRKRIL